MVRLSNVFKSIRDGMGKREDYFEVKPAVTNNSKMEEEFKQQVGGEDAIK
jgi:hypothetical protein